MHSVTNQPKQKLMLQSFDIKEIIFNASEETILQFKGKALNMDFISENRFTERYKESFSIIVAFIYLMKYVHIYPLFERLFMVNLVQEILYLSLPITHCCKMRWFQVCCKKRMPNHSSITNEKKFV